MCASANDITKGLTAVLVNANASKMQQPAYKCEKMQMRALFVNGPIPGTEHVPCLEVT